MAHLLVGNMAVSCLPGTDMQQQEAAARDMLYAGQRQRWVAHGWRAWHD
jgi:hypothetical protein